jgi:hypothetical protein
VRRRLAAFRGGFKSAAFLTCLSWALQHSGPRQLVSARRTARTRASADRSGGYDGMPAVRAKKARAAPPERLLHGKTRGFYQDARSVTRLSVDQQVLLNQRVWALHYAPSLSEGDEFRRAEETADGMPPLRAVMEYIDRELGGQAPVNRHFAGMLRTCDGGAADFAQKAKSKEGYTSSDEEAVQTDEAAQTAEAPSISVARDGSETTPTMHGANRTVWPGSPGRPGPWSAAWIEVEVVITNLKSFKSNSCDVVRFHLLHHLHTPRAPEGTSSEQRHTQPPQASPQ